MKFISAILVVAILSVDAINREKKLEKLQVGIKKRIPKDSCPKVVENGDNIKVHYTGSLFKNGEQFDSSVERNEPLAVSIGSNMVVKGFEQGLLGMCVGEKRRVLIPSELGYGARGSPPKIPEDADLVFDLELVSIDERDEL